MMANIFFIFPFAPEVVPKQQQQQQQKKHYSISMTLNKREK